MYQTLLKTSFLLFSCTSSVVENCEGVPKHPTFHGVLDLRCRDLCMWNQSQLFIQLKATYSLISMTNFTTGHINVEKTKKCQ